MKTPKFLTKLSAVLTPKPKKRLQATARAARPSVDDYDDEEPTTKLSSAFIVVLILHVVAVGGIYAFNSIKASRRDREVVNKTTEAAAPAVVAPPAKTSTSPAAPAAPRRVETTAAPVPEIAPAKPQSGRRYEVKSGDNATKIAFAYNVSAADLLAANQLKEGAVLRPGQILAIPAAKTASKPAAEASKSETATKTSDIPATKTTPGLYTVKKGDTFTSIARSLGQTVEELTKVNKTVNPKKLQLGQVLKVPPRKN